MEVAACCKMLSFENLVISSAKAPHVCGSEKDKTLLGFSDRKELNMEYLAAYLILFTICLLTVARIIPYQIPLVLVLIYMLLRNRENISRVDYSLLATFFALFIFIGNQYKRNLIWNDTCNSEQADYK